MSALVEFDLASVPLREVNAALQKPSANDACFEVANPMGQHAVACGLTQPLSVTINGHVGYYCAGMNQLANIVVKGNAGTGVAENMMSGTVRVTGDASQSAGASGCGGMLVIEGDASARCAIALR